MPFPRPSPETLLAHSVTSTSQSLQLAIGTEQRVRFQVHETLRLLCGDAKQFTPPDTLEVTPSDSDSVYELVAVKILDGREAGEKGLHAADGFAAVFTCRLQGEDWSIGVSCFELTELARILNHLAIHKGVTK